MTVAHVENSDFLSHRETGAILDKGPQVVKAGGDGLAFSTPALLKLIQNRKPFLKQSFENLSIGRLSEHTLTCRKRMPGSTLLCRGQVYVHLISHHYVCTTTGLILSGLIVALL